MRSSLAATQSTFCSCKSQGKVASADVLPGSDNFTFAGTRKAPSFVAAKAQFCIDKFLGFVSTRSAL